MEENINALDEIHKGSCMGIDAIKFTIEKVQDENLKKFLEKMDKEYKTTNEKIEKIYPKYNDGKPHETGFMAKAMTEMQIDMKTMTDQSNSKIAELLLQGVNMGIIEGRKILNNKEINEEVRNILNEYVTMQEESVETLKKYL